MNATVEVAPTATTNCECKEEWYEVRPVHGMLHVDPATTN